MVLSSELDHLVSRMADGFIYLFTHMISGQRWQVTARKEVIVSAGTFNTPQLLMLSGIGDPAELTSLGIPTRVRMRKLPNTSGPTLHRKPEYFITWLS